MGNLAVWNTEHIVEWQCKLFTLRWSNASNSNSNICRSISLEWEKNWPFILRAMVFCQKIWLKTISKHDLCRKCLNFGLIFYFILLEKRSSLNYDVRVSDGISSRDWTQSCARGHVRQCQGAGGAQGALPRGSRLRLARQLRGGSLPLQTVPPQLHLVDRRPGQYPGNQSTSVTRDINWDLSFITDRC